MIVHRSGSLFSKDHKYEFEKNISELLQKVFKSGVEIGEKFAIKDTPEGKFFIVFNVIKDNIKRGFKKFVTDTGDFRYLIKSKKNQKKDQDDKTKNANQQTLIQEDAQDSETLSKGEKNDD